MNLIAHHIRAATIKSSDRASVRWKSCYFSCCLGSIWTLVVDGCSIAGAHTVQSTSTQAADGFCAKRAIPLWFSSSPPHWAAPGAPSLRMPECQGPARKHGSQATSSAAPAAIAASSSVASAASPTKPKSGKRVQNALDQHASKTAKLSHNSPTTALENYYFRRLDAGLRKAGSEDAQKAEEERAWLEEWEEGSAIDPEAIEHWPQGAMVTQALVGFMKAGGKDRVMDLATWRRRWPLGITSNVWGRFEDVRWLLFAPAGPSTDSRYTSADNGEASRDQLRRIAYL